MVSCARLRYHQVHLGFRTGAARLPHRSAESDSGFETEFPGGRPAAVPHRKRTESGRSRRGGRRLPSRIVACAPSCLPERIDYLKALYLLAVLEVFGEQDIRPGIERGFHDQRVPVRESRRLSALHRAFHHFGMERLYLELAKGIYVRGGQIGG